jgi:hypothetical protein
VFALFLDGLAGRGRIVVTDTIWFGLPGRYPINKTDILRAFAPGRIRGYCEIAARPAPSLQSESSAAWEAQRPAALELRGSVPIRIPQTQANRTQFGGVCEDEFSWHAERARQFTDRHEGIVFGINHTRQLARAALGVYPASQRKTRRQFRK